MKLWASLVLLPLCLPILNVKAETQSLIVSQLTLQPTLPLAIAQAADSIEAPDSAPPEAESTQVDPADERARELFENGRMLYEEGEYEAAISAWEEAHRLSKRPLLLFNIANAYERLGDLPMALDALNRYRAFAPAEERDVLERRIHSISTRLQAKESEVVVPPKPELEPTPEAPVIQDPVDSLPPPPMRLPEEPAQHNQSTPYILGGVSLASAGMGALFAQRAFSHTIEGQQYCDSLSNGDLLCTAEAQAPFTQANRWAIAADGAFILAIGSGIAGGLIWKQGRNVAIQPLFLKDGGGVALGGVF